MTTPFDPLCVYHCNLLLKFLTVVNYRYIAVLRKNGFLRNNKINCTTFILRSLNYFEEYSLQFLTVFDKLFKTKMFTTQLYLGESTAELQT